MKYQITDCVVASELPLPELCVADQTAAAHWRVGLGGPGAAPLRQRAFHHWDAAQGYRWASFSRHPRGVTLHFARTAVFVVDEAERAVTCYPIGRTSVDALRPVLLNQVFPLLFGYDRLVLHASSVATPAGAVVFAGPPGLGKSTLAAALALRGLPLITDDFLVVDQTLCPPRAVPSGIEPRLWPDSLEAILPGHARRFPRVGQRTLKRRISPAGAVGVWLASQAAPIARIFVLSQSQAAGSIGHLPPAQAVPALTGATFVVHVDEPPCVRETFERVTALVANVPVLRLGPLRDFSRLDALCELVGAVSLARAG